VTTILLVVIGIAMALMIWQFFTPRPSEELRIGPIDVSGNTVVFTVQNVGSVDAVIEGVDCYEPGTGQPTYTSGNVTPLGGGTTLKQGETRTFTADCSVSVAPGQPVNVMVFTKNKAYGPFTVIVRSAQASSSLVPTS
jgi:hypothetical protein